MPDEDPFCASLPSELCWGMHSNSSLHSRRLCEVGNRISRELLDILRSTERDGKCWGDHGKWSVDRKSLAVHLSQILYGAIFAWLGPEMPCFSKC